MNHLNEDDYEWEEIDLIKADVYSLGLTIYYAATGESVKGMN